MNQRNRTHVSVFWEQEKDRQREAKMWVWKKLQLQRITEKKNEFHENEKQIDAVGVCVCDYIVLALRLATGYVAKRV